MLSPFLVHSVLFIDHWIHIIHKSVTMSKILRQTCKMLISVMGQIDSIFSFFHKYFSFKTNLFKIFLDTKYNIDTSFNEILNLNLSCYRRLVDLLTLIYVSVKKTLICVHKFSLCKHVKCEFI